MDRSTASTAPPPDGMRGSRARRPGGPHIRFGVDRAAMNAAMRSDCLSNGAAARPTRRLRSIIFDTAANDLGKQNILLRGYEMHGASFVELSWSRPAAADSGAARSAIELRVPSLDIGKMLGCSEELRQQIADRPLEARCVAEVDRRERMIELSDARIAVRFDDGFLEYRGRRAPLLEIELWLVAGEEPRLWRLAAELSRQAPLRCLPLSAAEQALRETAGQEIRAIKARRVRLDPRASLDEAIVAMAGSCLDHFLANWPALAHSPAPEEAIHQLRVALRRLRAGVGLLRRGVESEGLERAGARAKEIAASLGETRNLDVLKTMLADGPLAQANGEPSYYALLDAVECRRAERHAAAQALIAAPETTQFVLDLRATLAARDWRAVAKENGEAPIDTSAPGSARAFAIRSLDRLHRKATKKARGLAELTPAQRHEARIAFKKARYGAEFFESLFDTPSRARKYLRRASALQDALGAANDMAVAADLLRDIGEERRAAGPASAFAIGWCAHAQEAGAADWRKIEKSLKKLEPFWR
ncbi:CHAD domain-containing protein [Methylosinus sp. Sm6]|uniref:CYTH and CHAD domain-containing protein n=1 Tax=Methylosinus sp. Sm6 TaxID=2866948 RepID=UPI001C996DC5|nr:CHAD domain-containing protein [Methylosinus sp. Sm6]MBY6243497.1 CHAD domain-containing protein [Methylosinus sp. Sm6]